MMRVKVLLMMLMVGLLGSCERNGDEMGEELELVGYEITVAEFHRAAGAGEVEVMGVMGERGVDVHGEVEGESALHVAARKGRIGSMRFLLDHGIPVDVVGREGRTPLMVAAEVDQAGAVAFLLTSGADAGLRDDRGYRALTLAAEAGRTEVMEDLAVGPREHLDDALLLAALCGHAEVVDDLAGRGASVYARMEDGKTALMMASREGHEEVVEVLLKHGANRYALDLEGLTAGQIAMRAGQLEVGEILLAPPGEEEFALPEIPELAEAEMAELNVAGELLLGGIDLESDGSGGEVAVSAPAPEGRPMVPPVRSPDPVPVAGDEPVAQVVSVQTGAPEGVEVPALPPVVEMTEYRERPLPMRVEGVSGKEVRVRFLFGENERVTVREGEDIPFTGLRVVEVRERRQHTKESGNGFADVSAVLVEDPRTGLQRELVTHVSASAHDPFAVVRSHDGRNQVARRGSLIHGADGGRFTVLDVRPTQVVLENLATGEVVTVSLAGR